MANVLDLRGQDFQKQFFFMKNVTDVVSKCYVIGTSII